MRVAVFVLHFQRGKNSIMRLLCSVIGVLILGCATAQTEPRRPASADAISKITDPYAWIEVGPDGKRFARLVLPGHDCPQKAQADGQDIGVKERPDRTPTF